MSASLGKLERAYVLAFEVLNWSVTRATGQVARVAGLGPPRDNANGLAAYPELASIIRIYLPELVPELDAVYEVWMQFLLAVNAQEVVPRLTGTPMPKVAPSETIVGLLPKVEKSMKALIRRLEGELQKRTR